MWAALRVRGIFFLFRLSSFEKNFIFIKKRIVLNSPCFTSLKRIENWPEEHLHLKLGKNYLFWDICGTRGDFHLSSKIWNGIRGFLSRHLHSNLVEDWQAWQIHLYYYVYIICIILVSCESNSSPSCESFRFTWKIENYTFCSDNTDFPSQYWLECVPNMPPSVIAFLFEKVVSKKKLQMTQFSS